MARIRTIKPEFFTSEDIVSLSPLARLLYIALWCEADKEGRMVWRPATFKLRYLPGDDCSCQALCDELVKAGLVALYGDGHAYIPAFQRHQHINPRESASALPDPNATATRRPRVGTRQPRDVDAQVGREGKGKEGKGKEGEDSGAALRAAPPTPPPAFDGRNAETLNGKAIVHIAADFDLPEEWGLDAEKLGFKTDEILRESERFRQYWVAGKGSSTRRSVTGWRQSWSNWLSKAAERGAR